VPANAYQATLVQTWDSGLQR